MWGVCADPRDGLLDLRGYPGVVAALQQRHGVWHRCGMPGRPGRCRGSGHARRLRGMVELFRKLWRRAAVEGFSVEDVPLLLLHLGSFEVVIAAQNCVKIPLCYV
jgi:hypothetical protein